MIVLKGSRVMKDVAKYFKGVKQREAIIKEYCTEKDGDLYMNSDRLFGSPSSAACFCLGTSSNGWKDWKDGKARCERKIDVMEHWVDILSDRYKGPDKEDVIRTWGELFDISAAEIGMIMNSAFYAPVICEGDEIPSVLAGLLEYVSKNQKDFLIDSILTSDHPLAVIIKALAIGELLLDAALHKAPSMSVQELSEFISSHLNGWSLSREVKTGNYRIYGKVARYNVLKPANSSSPVEQPQ